MYWRFTSAAAIFVFQCFGTCDVSAFRFFLFFVIRGYKQKFDLKKAWMMLVTANQWIGDYSWILFAAWTCIFEISHFECHATKMQRHCSRRNREGGEGSASNGNAFEFADVSWWRWSFCIWVLRWAFENWKALSISFEIFYCSILFLMVWMKAKWIWVNNVLFKLKSPINSSGLEACFDDSDWFVLI